MTSQLDHATQEEAFQQARADPVKRLLEAPNTIEELDIPISIVHDILLRMLFNEGHVNLPRFTDVLRLERTLIDSILERMQYEQIVEVASAGTMGRFTYTYSLTDAGIKRAHDSFERSQYVGPAPVPIDKYSQMIILQTEHNLRITPSQVKQALS